MGAIDRIIVVAILLIFALWIYSKLTHQTIPDTIRKLRESMQGDTKK